MAGQIYNNTVRILIDTGAFCNCISQQYFNTRLSRYTPLAPSGDNEHFTTANNASLAVLGSVTLGVKLGGRTVPAKFYVVENLSQDVILGIEFLQSNNAVLDYTRKRLFMHNGATYTSLLTSIDFAKTIRTIKRTRIPAQHEIIFPVRLPELPDTVGITESLPQTLSKGIKVAAALVDCNTKTAVCRVANPTNRPVLWRAGHAFAYLSPIQMDNAGVNLIDVSDCFNTAELGHDNDTKAQCNAYADERHDDEQRGVGDRDIPPHNERLRELHRLGVKIGTDVLTQAQAEKLSKILYQSRDIMAENITQVPEARVPRHTIPLIDTKPAIQKRFRYDPVKEQKLENLCDELLAAGIIKESSSLWCSPVFLISKPDGSSRFLVDFRAVNAKTEPLYCALPSLEDVFDQIAEEKPNIFSVLDMRAGYYGIGIDEASQPYTAFSTKNRHFQFTRLNMGYVNSGSFFTQSLYKIFATEIRKHMIIYVDDVFIMHRDVDEHLEFLSKIFAKFREYNLRLHPKKMNIATSSANFLGYTLHQGGYTVDTGRCKIVKEYPQPKNVREVKKFLGIAQYFRRLIKNYSKRSAPLRELLAKDKQFEWTDRQEQSFCDIRDTLCSAPVLGYPDRNKSLRVVLDACATGLGYILVNVNDDGTETPLFYGGRSTTRAERNYSATELELASLLAAVKTYWSYLANTEFEIVTDHISLTYIKNLRFGPSKLVRASLLLNQFKFKVTHLAGRNNSAADSISRTTDLQTDPLTAFEAARFQADDATDLCLDYATTDERAQDKLTDSNSKAHRNVGIQCDIRDIICIGSDPTSGGATKLADQFGTRADLDWGHGDAIPSVHCVTESADHDNENARIGTYTPAQDAPRACDDRLPCPLTNVNTSSATMTDLPGPKDETRAALSSDTARNDRDSGNSVAGQFQADDDINLQTQRLDSKLAQIIDYLQHGDLPDENTTARRVLLTKDQFTIRDNILMHLGFRRQKNNKTDHPVIEQICVPKKLQPILLARYHAQLMHCGYEKQYLTMKQRVYWENLYTDVRNYVAQCETCHLAKANKHPIKAKIQCREVPPQIFQRIHMDHVKISVKGATHGYTHALVLIDAMSLCCEIIPVKSTSAAETCSVLLTEWIAKYGVFSELVTDRHASFTGKLTRLLTESCGIRHVLISPYHSRSNGQAEKMNDIVLQGIRIHCKGLTDWPKLLPAIAAAYKAGTIPSRGASPFKVMYGVDMRLPVETALCKQLPAHIRPTENVEMMCKQLTMMRAHAQQLAQASRQRSAQTANQSKHTPDFLPGDRVYKVRDALTEIDDRKTTSKFEGPFVILERGSNNVYKLAHLYSGKPLKNFVHVNKLKSGQSARADKRKSQTIAVINKQNKHASQKHGIGRFMVRPRAMRGRPRPSIAPLGARDFRVSGNSVREIAETDSEMSDFRAAVGEAELDLDFDSELFYEKSTPVAHNDEHDGKAQCNGRHTLREGQGRGTPRFPCRILRTEYGRRSERPHGDDKLRCRPRTNYGREITPR